MIIEKMFFNLLAFSLFVIIFSKIIRKNDTSYISILTLQAVGIGANFIEMLYNLQISIFVKTIIYVISIILPICIIIIEYKGISFSELLYLGLGKLFLNFKNTRLAKIYIQKLVEKCEDSYIGHKLLGQIYEKEGGMRKAIDEYVKAVDIKKNDYDTYYKIAFLLNELGRKEEAGVMLTNLLKKKPEYYEASILLGDILYEQEKFKEAINVYNDALKYKENDYDLYYNLGMVYTRLNDFKNAKEAYDKAAMINSLSYNAYYNLGQISLIFDDIEEAEQYFIKALKGEEIEAQSYYQLAKICIIKNEKEKAINYINIAIELDPHIMKKVNNENLFILIRSNIVLSAYNEKEIIKKPSEKEMEINEYLDGTYLIVDKLNTKSNYQNHKEQQSQDIERDININ